ncbi:MAG TPA: hypothetical protein VMV66_02875 [Candidatus Humimicrobiaceae bacterium]|nr:hypothetical protein [Candidatus Humimicrobiaceae bacterium]
MSNYPKIIFKYSWIYDQTWKEGWLARKKTKNYPSSKKVFNYIKKVRRTWKKEEKRALQEISRITDLKWKSKSIDCYVVGRCRPFSYPLTMPIYEKYPDYFIDVLTHELIHNIFIQNEKETEKAWRFFEKKYKKESRITKNHIVLHAIHSHIYSKLYNEKRLKRNIKFTNRFPDYKKSWQIIQKVGYRNIIDEFVKRI